MDLFEQLDQDFDWPGEEMDPLDFSAVPSWLRYDVDLARDAMIKAQKKGSVTGKVGS